MGHSRVEGGPLSEWVHCCAQLQCQVPERFAGAWKEFRQVIDEGGTERVVGAGVLGGKARFQTWPCKNLAGDLPAAGGNAADQFARQHTNHTRAFIKVRSISPCIVSGCPGRASFCRQRCAALERILHACAHKSHQSGPCSHVFGLWLCSGRLSFADACLGVVRPCCLRRRFAGGAQMGRHY